MRSHPTVAWAALSIAALALAHDVARAGSNVFIAGIKPYRTIPAYRLTDEVLFFACETEHYQLVYGEPFQVVPGSRADSTPRLFTNVFLMDMRSEHSKILAPANDDPRGGPRGELRRVLDLESNYEGLPALVEEIKADRAAATKGAAPRTDTSASYQLVERGFFFDDAMKDEQIQLLVGPAIGWLPVVGAHLEIAWSDGADLARIRLELSLRSDPDTRVVETGSCVATDWDEMLPYLKDPFIKRSVEYELIAGLAFYGGSDYLECAEKAKGDAAALRACRREMDLKKVQHYRHYLHDFDALPK